MSDPLHASRQNELDGDPRETFRRLDHKVNELERMLREKSVSGAPSAPGADNKLGARRDGVFKAISSAPSFNWTPLGPAMVALPYTTVSDLSGSLGVASNVRFNGKPAYTLGSYQPSGKGDEAGSGGGIRSGTVNGIVKPASASTTVRAGGKQVVRDGDANTMNGGNNPGTYVTSMPTSSSAPKDARKTSNPPIALETPEEKSALRRWLAQSQERLRQAGKHPVDAFIGAGKGIVNIPSNLAEAMAKGGTEQQAMEMDEAAALQLILGRSHEARVLAEGAAATRKAGQEIALPKMAMDNAAQEGGDLVATALQLFAGGVGLVRGAVKAVVTGAGTSKVVKGIVAADAMKPGTFAVGPASDGVHVAMNAHSKIADSAMAGDWLGNNPVFHIVGENFSSETIGAASSLGRINLINPAGRMDNCTACVSANIFNKLEGRTIDNLMTAQQIEAKWGNTGASRGLSEAQSLSYVERATGAIGVKTPMLAPDAPVGHYTVFGTSIENGTGHIMYGQVLPNGRAYFYDPQIGGGTMTYDYLRTVYKNMRTYHMRPE